MGAFGNSPMLPIDTYGLSRTVFELFSWVEKRFRPGYDDTYRSRTYRFVERQKVVHRACCQATYMCILVVKTLAVWSLSLIVK